MDVQDGEGESMRDEYDFLQDKANFMQDRVNELKEENEELREKLEFLEQGQPHPCTFDGKRHVSQYTLKDWLNKLKEEVSEVEAEVDKVGDVTPPDVVIRTNTQKEDEFKDLAEELTDVITVCASTLNWLGWTIYGRAQLQARVNEKNKRRGYWE